MCTDRYAQHRNLSIERQSGCVPVRQTVDTQVEVDPGSRRSVVGRDQWRSLDLRGGPIISIVASCYAICPNRFDID